MAKHPTQSVHWARWIKSVHLVKDMANLRLNPYIGHVGRWIKSVHLVKDMAKHPTQSVHWARWTLDKIRTFGKGHGKTSDTIRILGTLDGG